MLDPITESVAARIAARIHPRPSVDGTGLWYASVSDDLLLEGVGHSPGEALANLADLLEAVARHL